MNINIRLSNELQEQIQNEANKQLQPIIDEILKNDAELKELLRKTIQGQVKNEALKILQSPEMRSKMAALVYPIVYRTFGLEVKE